MIATLPPDLRIEPWSGNLRGAAEDDSRYYLSLMIKSEYA